MLPMLPKLPKVTYIKPDHRSLVKLALDLVMCLWSHLVLLSRDEALGEVSKKYITNNFVLAIFMP